MIERIAPPRLEIPEDKAIIRRIYLNEYQIRIMDMLVLDEMEVKEVAHKLNQHENTIRHHIRETQKIFGVKSYRILCLRYLRDCFIPD